MAGWQIWMLVIAAFVWALDVHRRVSATMEAVRRIEARLGAGADD